MTIKELEERQSFLTSLTTFKECLEKLTQHSYYPQTAEEFQDMVEDFQFEIDLELKEKE